MARPLRSGYSTGSCAAAAAKAAAMLLCSGSVPDKVDITLPAGETASFKLYKALITDNRAICSVLKDAGDDPDITNGAEVEAVVEVAANKQAGGITINGGIGIGRVTKPGLAVSPGEWAINPVPRQMIANAVREIFPTGDITVTISIPDGEARAAKTLNARLGIIGGLSILGTTGIVRPISAKAWTDTIDTALDVAIACKCDTVVLCTGRTSELAAMKHLRQEQGTRVRGPNKLKSKALTGPLHLPEEAFIMMGDHILHTLQSCQKRNLIRPLLACQFAKLVKIACGHANTHAASAEMELGTLLGWAQKANLEPKTIALIKRSNTARELIISSHYDPALMQLVGQQTKAAVALHTPQISPAILLCGYNGETFLL